MKDILQERFFQLLLECSQRKASATEFSEAIEEFNPPIFLPKWRKRKSSKILEFQNFALIFYLLSRCVRRLNLVAQSSYSQHIAKPSLSAVTEMKPPKGYL